MALTQEDVDQLNLLRIFFYVLAGLHVLGSCFFGIYLAVGAALVGTSVGASAKMADPPPAFIGWVFIAVALVGLAVVLTIAALQYLTGKRLGERSHYTFVMVCAALTCLSMPFGTLLGVFTLIVLQRPTVKAAFGVT